jgi:hypothetical protein
VRSLANYSLREWVVLKPLVHRFKRLRNRATMLAYCRAGDDIRDAFLAAHPELRGANIAVAIAFNTAWCIELWIRSMRANVPGCVLLVADNSSRPAARAEIAALCRIAGVAYLSLPPNPTRSPNRSHGLALNWTYVQVLRRLEPAMFAFLDHDLFPVESFDLVATVAKQPVYGRYKQSPWQGAWSLWAGYCAFSYKAVSGHNLDFTYDGPLLLDTGGLNWPRFYRHLDVDTMRFCSERIATFEDPASDAELIFEQMDTFLHFGSASHKQRAYHDARHALVAELVRKAEARAARHPDGG